MATPEQNVPPEPTISTTWRAIVGAAAGAPPTMAVAERRHRTMRAIASTRAGRMRGVEPERAGFVNGGALRQWPPRPGALRRPRLADPAVGKLPHVATAA